MPSKEIFDITLTFFGLISVLAGSRIAFNIHKNKSTLTNQWKFFLVLISSFIIGYLFFIVKFIFSPTSFDSLMLSLIFFFGGIFVYLTMNLFKNSIAKIEAAHHLVHSIEELRRVAEHDDLTNLYNRKFFKKYLNDVLSLCKISEKQFALLFVDVNNFKSFNDNYGHLAGDQVLISIANYFRSFFRRDDIIARLGGDEFAILIEINKDQNIKQYADKLLDRVNSMKLDLNGNHLKINISIGISIISSQTESVDKALEHADNACYDAKKRKQLGSQYSLV